MNKLIMSFIAVTFLALMTACTAQHNSGDNKHGGIPGCAKAGANIKIKLDTATKTPALVDHGQNTVCVESGYKISWTLVETPGSNREFTIFFKDGSFTETTTSGRLQFDRTSVTEITAYSYGISMPDAKDLDPIIIIVPTIGN